MIVILASGEGSNFSAIVDSRIKIDRLITNNPNANVINRAKNAHVFYSIVSHEELNIAIPEDADLIVLAGYNRVLDASTCKKFDRKIINIHPSLLPAVTTTGSKSWVLQFIM